LSNTTDHRKPTKQQVYLGAGQWLSALIAMPRTVGPKRTVQLVGLPSIALIQLERWASAYATEELAAARDSDGLLRSFPEPLYYRYLESILLPVPQGENK
jgi:hypothetical protein